MPESTPLFSKLPVLVLLALQTALGTAVLISLAVAFSHPGVLLIGQKRL
jgi:hypothetical protein